MYGLSPIIASKSESNGGTTKPSISPIITLKSQPNGGTIKPTISPIVVLKWEDNYYGNICICSDYYNIIKIKEYDELWGITKIQKWEELGEYAVIIRILLKFKNMMNWWEYKVIRWDPV